MAIVKPFRISATKQLLTTPVFDSYWKFAATRQDVFFKRIRRDPLPWTSDPILRNYRFTNVYRASDRVSQYLIKNVIYGGIQSGDEVFFRTMLFKFFNKIKTWDILKENIGEISWKKFDFDRYHEVLENAFHNGCTLYSAAYIMPNPPFGAPRKHTNHLALLVRMMKDRLPLKIERANSLQEVFDLLRGYPSVGDFLAFQFAIDLNYSEIINFSEMDFVVAGPGARSGIKKCFLDSAELSDEDIIRAVAEHANREFSERGIFFQTLWGRLPHLIDYQNLFCEIDKYARVAHPGLVGSGRTRIKRTFSASTDPMPQWYPPKWSLPIDRESMIADPSISGHPRQLHFEGFHR